MFDVIERSVLFSMALWAKEEGDGEITLFYLK